MKDADDCRSLLLLFTNFVCLFVFSSFENFFCVFFSSRTPVAYSRCQPKKKQAFGLLGIVWSFFLKAWTSQKSVIAHVALLAVVHLAAVSVTRRQRGNGCDFINQPATDDDVSSWLRSALLLFLLDCFFFVFVIFRSVFISSLRNRIDSLLDWTFSFSPHPRDLIEYPLIEFDIIRIWHISAKMGRLKCFLLLAGKFFLNPSGISFHQIHFIV
jgi:hypothetical protein